MYTLLKLKKCFQIIYDGLLSYNKNVVKSKGIYRCQKSYSINVENAKLNGSASGLFIT